MLQVYASGAFPMAESRDSEEIFLVEPKRRGVLPLDGLKISRSLRRTVRQDRFQVHVDADFEAVVDACSAPRAGSEDSWINPLLRQLYLDLHALGVAHSVECRQNGRLVGGLFGIALSGAFFGESMFSTATDASKVALVHLVARLRSGGFCLLDTQFSTAHLESLGVIEIARKDYLERLGEAMRAKGDFYCWPVAGVPGTESLQAVSQMS